MVLDSAWRAADLRRLPHGAGAVIAESSTCGATTHDDAERSLRRECWAKGSTRRQKAIEGVYEQYLS
jgi:hypothetical protein